MNKINLLKKYITDYPDMEVVIICENKRQGELLYKDLKEHINFKDKPIIVSSREGTSDGLNSESIFILGDKWMNNPNADTIISTTCIYRSLMVDMYEL